MNRPARATKAELDRALRAAKDAGPEFGVEVAPDGTIRIIPMSDRKPRPQVPVAPIRDFAL